MQNTDIQQILLSLFEYAQTAKHLEFHFLTNWLDYKDYQAKRKSFKALIKVLQSSANRIFKNYCKSILLGNSDFNKLLIYQMLCQTISFYKKELLIITEIIYEYEAYLLEGNYFWAFLGSVRPEEALRDFRD